MKVPIFLIILGCVGLIVVGFVVLMFFVSLWEKQLLKEYVPFDFKLLPEPSPYFLEMNRVAGELGFKYAGAFKQERKGRAYQAYMACWVSPDSTTLLRIGAGKTLRVAIRRTVLGSYYSEGRLLETTDEFGAHDFSGLTEREIVVNADLGELWREHQRRLAAEATSPNAFRWDNVLAVFETMQGLKASRLEQRGLARFINPERTIFRYTVRGALLICSAGLLLQSGQGMAQSDRADLRRPGE